jgi:hypothetical protein
VEIVKSTKNSYEINKEKLRRAFDFILCVIMEMSKFLIRDRNCISQICIFTAKLENICRDTSCSP